MVETKPNPTVGQAEHAVEREIGQWLGAIPEVRYVLTEEESDGYTVWAVVDDPDPEIRRRIYTRELDLIDRFPDTGFDFNVKLSYGRDHRALTDGWFVAYSR